MAMLVIVFEPLLRRFQKKRFGILGLFWLFITIFLLEYLASSIFDIVLAFKTDFKNEGAVHRDLLEGL